MKKTLKVIVLFFCILFLAAQAVAIASPASTTAKADIKNRSVILTWDPVSDAVGYNIYRKEQGEYNFRKINSAPLIDQTYIDDSVVSGRDYLFQVRALDVDGQESGGGPGVGAPLMTINTTANLSTLRDKPVEARSIRTGKMVTFAAPGDIITYRISYANIGYSSAKNIAIKYAIPSGTVIAGTPVVKKGTKAGVAYYDRAKQKWLTRIEKQENVTAVKLNIPKTIAPVKTEKEVNGIVDLNVVITL